MKFSFSVIFRLFLEHYEPRKDEELISSRKRHTSQAENEIRQFKMLLPLFFDFSELQTCLT